MCACEGRYVCSKCVGTPFDPHYEDDAHEPMDAAEFDAHEPMDAAEFDALINEDTRWTTWNGWV